MASWFDDDIEQTEMETLASLAANLVYRLPGCDDLMVRKTLQETYRDFCRRSCCLRTRRHFKISHSDAVVTVPPLFGGIVDVIGRVTYNGRKIRQPRDYEVRGACLAFSPRLVPEENVDEDKLPVVDVDVVEIPTINSEKIPCWFNQKHGDDICAGVLARLKRMANRPWSDPNEAAACGIQYENAVSEERYAYYAESNNGDFRFATEESTLV